MLKSATTAFTISLFTIVLHAQKPEVELLTSGAKTSLRGLSVVNDNVVWVSGSNGMVGRSANGGKNWHWMTVPGFEKTDFRDIEAFDANTALIMGVGSPAYILKTSDAGETWRVVYENNNKEMFLDAMDFANNQDGIVIGDPVNGKVFMARTIDSGNTWEQDSSLVPLSFIDTGEAFFAASGSNIRLFENGSYLLVSGGLRSRIFTNKNVYPLPLLQGKESTGANSIDVFDNGLPKKPGRHIAIAGGDFAKDTMRTQTFIYSRNRGKTWRRPKVPPQGYRSCVEYLAKKLLLTCGTSGVDYSSNSGKSWQPVSKEGFHVCRIAKIGSTVFLAGSGGRVAKLVWNRNN